MMLRAYAVYNVLHPGCRVIEHGSPRVIIHPAKSFSSWAQHCHRRKRSSALKMPKIIAPAQLRTPSPDICSGSCKLLNSLPIHLCSGDLVRMCSLPEPSSQLSLKAHAFDIHLSSRFCLERRPCASLVLTRRCFLGSCSKRTRAW